MQRIPLLLIRLQFYLSLSFLTFVRAPLTGNKKKHHEWIITEKVHVPTYYNYFLNNYSTIPRIIHKQTSVHICNYSICMMCTCIGINVSQYNIQLSVCMDRCDDDDYRLPGVREMREIRCGNRRQKLLTGNSAYCTNLLSSAVASRRK